MHVLRLFLKSGAQVELLYRNGETADFNAQKLHEAKLPVFLEDDFGKSVVSGTGLDAFTVSDYAQELAGAVEIAWHKQQANEAHQKRVAAQHGMIGRLGPQMPGVVLNG